MKLTRRHAAGGAAVAAVLAIATPFIGHFEGLVLHVYPDAVGVPTYCYGETQDPRPGHRYTKVECDALLSGRLAEYDAGVRRCITRPLPAKTEAAFVSMAYNVGLGAFCSSTLARKANAGDLAGACAELSKWDKAGGRVLKGLTVRRGAERALCLEGVTEGGGNG